MLLAKCRRCGTQIQERDPIELKLSHVTNEFELEETSFLCASCLEKYKEWLSNEG